MARGHPAESPSDVVIRDGKILDLVPHGQGPEDAEILDAANMIVAPGLVDGHRHVWQSLLRTVAADWSLYDYLVNMRTVYSSQFSAEDAHLANYVGALEAIDSGVTTLVDHCHLINSPAHTDALIDGLESAGVRGIFCYGLFVNPTHHPFHMEPGPGWRFDDMRRIRKGRLSSDSGRLLFGVDPQEAEAVPFETVLSEIALSRELGAKRISYHVGMGAYDGRQEIVAQLGRARALGEDLLFVHGAALSDQELGLLRDSGASLVVTPETELQMGMGFPAAFRARDAGVRTALGVDIVSNYPGDLFGQMRLALQVARGQENDAVARSGRAPRRIRLGVRDALQLGTIAGAAAVGLEHAVGSLERGKAADIILMSTASWHMTPAVDATAAIILGASASDVDTVMIDGIIRKRNGRLVAVDLDSIRERVLASSARIIAAASTVDRTPIEAIWNGVFPHLN